MFAIFKSGGKQHRVEKGDTVRLEKLEQEVGAKIEFEEVLLIGEGDNVKIGEPVVKGGKIKAEVVGHGRGEKVKIIKFKRRKHHMKQMGHRQWFTEVQITGITGGPRAKKADAEEAASEE